jgi:ribonuclease HI
LLLTGKRKTRTFAAAMEKPKKKYYVVWEGHQKGIFDTWDQCKRQVDGFAGAKYKSFSSLDEAKKAFGSNLWNYIGKTAKPAVDTALLKSCGEPLKEAICVDAACSGNPGVLEYRGVNIITGQEIFRRGPFPEGTNNIGEFLAIVSGLVYLKQNNLSLPLYSDSRNAILWVKAKKVNTKLVPNAKNKDLFDLLDRALGWLHANSYGTRILKWETKAWGEIPADFGRK